MRRPLRYARRNKTGLWNAGITIWSASQLARVLAALRDARTDYFGHLAFYLAQALFFTACRFHEWALLDLESLIRNPAGEIETARLRVKGGAYRDLPILPVLAQSLSQWFEFLDGVRGVRLRNGAGDFAGSRLVFPGRDGGPVANNAFNLRLAAACRRAQAPVISAHGLRHSAATLLLNEKGKNLRELQMVLGHQSLATTARYTHIDRERLRNVLDGLSF